jgi:hypothetical protein
VIPFSALKPKIRICIIFEEKLTERLHLFYILVGSVVTNIQDVLQSSSSEKTPINGKNWRKIYANVRLIISRCGAIAEYW